MAITKAQICDAIADTLGDAASVARTQSFDELGESIGDTPLLQVYPGTTWQQDPSGNTDRTTFGGGVRQTILVIHVDLYAHRRARMSEDMAALVNTSDEIETILEEQDKKPYFGLVGIQAFSWLATRVVFVYTDQEIKYAGVRYAITIRVF